LQIEAIVELLEVCLKTTDFQADNKFFQQKIGMAVGSSQSPIIRNIFTNHFEEVALDSAQHKPSLWLQHVYDTFVVWPHGPERLQNFLSHLNNLRPSIQFTLEIESNSVSRSEAQSARKRYVMAPAHFLSLTYFTPTM
jgi:hypothetical protein